jgi:hypothetical protein
MSRRPPGPGPGPGAWGSSSRTRPRSTSCAPAGERATQEANLTAGPKFRGRKPGGEYILGEPESEARDRVPTLADLRVTKNQSSCWQAVARLPEAEFEGRLTRAKERGARIARMDFYRRPAPTPTDSEPEAGEDPLAVRWDALVDALLAPGAETRIAIDQLKKMGRDAHALVERWRAELARRARTE